MNFHDALLLNLSLYGLVNFFECSHFLLVILVKLVIGTQPLLTFIDVANLFYRIALSVKLG